MQKSTNIVWHKTNVAREDRESLLKQKAKILWFTGLSGSGKSTLAAAVEKKLYDLGKLTYMLDGDNIRYGINSDLGFSSKDRKENIRRIGEISKLFVDAGVIVLACFISPFKEDRERVRSLVKDDFIEIFVDCPVEECEKRDPKNLYKKARNGAIHNFTGISSPYEKPENPELVVSTYKYSLEESVNIILEYILD
jgi:adenylylsulfate kinase (apsK)